MATRALLTKLSSLPLLPTSSRAFSRRFPSASAVLRLRPLLASVDRLALLNQPKVTHVRCMSTHQSTSSMRDSNPNFGNRPPKDTILLDGCDFEHWLVVVDPPPGDPSNPDTTRDEIIDNYIKTLAKVVGSEEEARMKIYSVSTRHYFAFGALVSEEDSYKIKELPGVRWVLPDSYLDVKNKDYGGEPFINGEAVPYDPKYHEEWVRNNARANERSRRNDRPRNFDRSRSFERRREQQNFQSRPPPGNFHAPGGVGPNVPPPPSNFNGSPAGPGPNAPPPPGFNSSPGTGHNMPPSPSSFNNNGGPDMPPPPLNFNSNGPNMPPSSSSFNSNAGPNMPPPNFNYNNQPPPPPPPMGNAEHGAYRNQYGGAPGMNQNRQMPPNPRSYEGRPPYQRGPGTPPGYPGAGPNPNQGNFYQGGNPNMNPGPGAYQGRGPTYQGGNNSPPPYQGGGNFQGGYGGSNSNYQQGGANAYGDSGSQGYQGRDVPGRDF
ncbi:multiple organellar RNA editing factor [Rhynchospora pubera]|uniref:Multiple organellar RNA editing factor n=1 Tax=Rhynchospora pubera TaxID=906938 RepID=A0AAV8HHJ7_9POAL|nr:multiple organellar RNA editing factor [Rhynchospora pubera]